MCVSVNSADIGSCVCMHIWICVLVVYVCFLAVQEGSVAVSERSAPALRPSQVKTTTAASKKDPLKKEGSRKDTAKTGKKAGHSGILCAC